MSGAGETGVFRVEIGAELTIRDLTVTDANPRSGTGIDNRGMLTIARSTITGSTQGFGDGGGVYNGDNGTLTLTRSTISDNDSGGIFNDGVLTVTASTFSGNSAFQGGAILNDGEATATGSTFSDNNARGDGGAIFILRDTNRPEEDRLTVTNSTFASNTAAKWGGAVRVAGAGTFTATNVTLTGNSATEGGGIANSAEASETLRSTIVANSPEGDYCCCVITDGQHNTSDDSSCAFTAWGSRNGTDPGLDPDGLSDNGGPTQTVALRGKGRAANAILAGDNGCAGPRSE